MWGWGSRPGLPGQSLVGSAGPRSCLPPSGLGPRSTRKAWAWPHHHATHHSWRAPSLRSPFRGQVMAEGTPAQLCVCQARYLGVSLTPSHHRAYTAMGTAGVQGPEDEFWLASLSIRIPACRSGTAQVLRATEHSGALRRRPCPGCPGGSPC